MKTLILLRHAKSDWASAGMRDIDRPLNPRGRRAAPLMGGYLAEQGVAPDLVLCSASARTRETWDRARTAFPGAPDPQMSDALYLAGHDAILREIRAAPDNAQTLLVIGHQPGLGDLARRLAAEETSGEGRGGASAAALHFPTCATAIFEIDATRWATLAPGAARLLRYATPRDLA